MYIPISPLTILAALLTGAFGAYLAYQRGRNPYIWFCVGFFFGALGAMIIFFAPRRKKALTKTSMDLQPPTQPQAPIIQGPKDKFWYYLNPEHQQIGPMSFEAFSAALQEGKISLSTYIWHEELSDWKFLKECLRPPE